MDQRLLVCLEWCGKCADLCNQVADRFRRELIDPQLEHRIRGVAQLAWATEDLIRRNQSVYSEVCSLCAPKMVELAVDLLPHSGMPEAKRCIDACLRCARECGEVAPSAPREKCPPPLVPGH